MDSCECEEPMKRKKKRLRALPLLREDKTRDRQRKSESLAAELGTKKKRDDSTSSESDCDCNHAKVLKKEEETQEIPFSVPIPTQLRTENESPNQNQNQYKQFQMVKQESSPVDHFMTQGVHNPNLTSSQIETYDANAQSGSSAQVKIKRNAKSKPEPGQEEHATADKVKKKRKSKQERTRVEIKIGTESQTNEAKDDLKEEKGSAKEAAQVQMEGVCVDQIMANKTTAPRPLLPPKPKPRAFTVKHPLMIPEILEVIFNFLFSSSSSSSSSCPLDADDDEQETLHACQRVNDLWNEVLTKRVESREPYPVEIPSRYHSFEFDSSFKSIVRAIPKHRATFSIHTMPNNYMHHFLKVVGPQIKNLTISMSWVVDHTNCHFIQYVSKYCRQLDELTIDLSDCRMSIFDEPELLEQELEKWNLKTKTGANANSNPAPTAECFLKIKTLHTTDNRQFKHNKLYKTLPITLSPFLQSLSFSGTTDQFTFLLKTIGQSARSLEHLQRLEFYSCTNAPLDQPFICFFLKQKWNLKSFKLRFLHNVPIRNARVLFHHLRNTLVELSVEFDYPDVKLDMPYEKNFLVPLNMPKLRKIDVNEQSTLSLVNAMHLPKLKSCVCFYSVLGRGGMFNQVSLENPPNFGKKGHALENLTVYENSIDLPLFDERICLQLKNPFANLKTLHLEHATHSMLQSILSNQVHLERLKLCNLYSLAGPEWDWNSSSQIDLSSRSIDWDEQLTGFQKPPITYVWPAWSVDDDDRGKKLRKSKSRSKSKKKSESMSKSESDSAGSGSVSTDGEGASTSKLKSAMVSCTGTGSGCERVLKRPRTKSRPKRSFPAELCDRTPGGDTRVPLKKIGPSITDLKKLKYLYIGFESTSSKLSDFTIYNGLMHLKQLQYLELNQHTFTKRALHSLRKRVLPFCRLRLND